MSVTVLKGVIVSAPALGALDVTEGGYLVAEDGRVTGVFSTLPERYAPCPVEDLGSALIVQSFADMHLHAPQYPMLGTGTDLPLLEWLHTYTFPAEARFQDADFARTVCRLLAQELLSHGTTRVCMFSSLHTRATLILMEELERAGIWGYVGKVNMDRNGLPGVLQETTQGSVRDTLDWLERCGSFSSVRPILTPRFTPSCTDELMAFLGRLAAERDLPVHSHLSENRSEAAWVRRLHPDCRRYWQTYDKFGLWGSRTLMAHCVWSDAAERRAMRRSGVTAVHCPTANLNLRSGTAPVRRLLQEGVPVALGSDIAGGSTLDMFAVAAAAVNASKIRCMTDPARPAPLTAAESWYLATSAGARWMGHSPGFAPGEPLHAMVIDDSALPPAPAPLTARQRLERALFRRQPGAIRAVWAAGRRVYPAP